MVRDGSINSRAMAARMAKVKDPVFATVWYNGVSLIWAQRSENTLSDFDLPKLTRLPPPALSKYGHGYLCHETLAWSVAPEQLQALS